MGDVVIGVVVTACLGVLTYYLIPLIRVKMSVTEREEVRILVECAVKAMEQIYLKNPGAGQDKLEGALKWLKERGISIDVAELKYMIEAAVFEMNHEDHGGDSNGKA